MIAPGERIEPRVLRLYGKVVSGSFTALKMRLNATAVQSPSDPVFYRGQSVTIFARFAAGAAPETLTVDGKRGSDPTSWTLSVAPAADDSTAIPVLWARERIRDLEEGTGTVGSRQTRAGGQREKSEILDLCRKYGLISRDTSYVAVEQRPDEEKTTGSVVLRKVPVQLTAGWHGTVSGLPRLSLAQNKLARASRPMDVQHLVVPGNRPSFLYCPPAAPRNERPMPELSRKKGALTGKSDTLLTLLAQQRPEGGFSLDKKTIKALGLQEDELKQIAGRIETRVEADGPVLLATAIVLWLLENKFGQRRDEWQMVVQKSVTWLEKQIEITGAAIGQVKLADWVAGYLGKRRINV
ncbi:MAG: hypothetical protein HY673_15815 [Chloroflexi bacterium]|nr:hypothetical protein [Chloroflexota bacterium]